eukprot:ANDGO_01641.mRNA.1 Lateral signaling target protein 2 homolog
MTAAVEFANAPITKESPLWQQDKDVKNCCGCNESFSMMNRKHHCRNCGKVFCTSCCFSHAKLPNWPTVERVCATCHLSYARGGRVSPTEVAGGADGITFEKPTGTAEYHDICVDSQKDGVTVSGAASLVLMRCSIKAKNVGVSKHGGGNVTLTECDVASKEGISTAGSIKLSMTGCTVIADDVCIRARGSGVLTLENCHLISKKGIAIECSGSVKVELINCTVSGKTGISGVGSCEFVIRGGCVSSQNALHPLLLKVPLPLPGKDGNTIVFKGGCKLDVSEGASIVGNNTIPANCKVSGL